MKKGIILFLFMALISQCLASIKSTYTNIGKFSVPFSKDAIVAKTPFQKSITVNVLSDVDQYLVLYKAHNAVSVKSVKEIMSRLEGKRLEIIKKNNSAIFYFTTDDNQYHVFSTKGGYLQFNTNNRKSASRLLKNTIKRIDI